MAIEVPYREIWVGDFEFTAPPGHTPTPLCVVARELRSGRTVRVWLDGESCPECPYPTDAGVLFVAFYNSAEIGCHLALGWPIPERMVDLFVEFRNLTNGNETRFGNGLLGVLTHYGLPALDSIEKTAMRDLAMRGGSYSEAERSSLLEYCESDVDALARLWPVMLPGIDLPRALLRGRYTAAAARMEFTGVPLDVETHDALREHWEPIESELTRAVDADYGVFLPTRFPINSELGLAVLEEAERTRLNPAALAEAACLTNKIGKAEHDTMIGGIRAARTATDLSYGKTERLRAEGKGYSDVPDFGERARAIAEEYPVMNLAADAGTDDDIARRLWEVLCESDPKPKSGVAEAIRQAIDLLSGGAHPRLAPLSFNARMFERYLTRTGIRWPQSENGKLSLSDETFRERAKAHPEQIGPLRELRKTLGMFRSNDLATAPDGRSRCMLSMFGTKTGRNKPSTSKFIFGLSAWLRSLIKPGVGRAIAYVDWSQQELAIAAALSGDPLMREAYTSGDFYLTFGKLAGVIPHDATKVSHARERDQFKTVSLGVLYGVGAESLALQLGVPKRRGQELLDLHKRTFRTFWAWIDRVEVRAMLTNEIHTAFGWTQRVNSKTKATSLQNFLMQATGAEMMRLAACYGTEWGLNVCAPVHDAFLIEASSDEIETATARMQDAMRLASEEILPGFSLKTDAKIVRYPDRYSDPRGEPMWKMVMGILDRIRKTESQTTFQDRATS